MDLPQTLFTDTTQHRLQVLARLIDLGAELAEAVVAEVRTGEAAAAGAVDAFERVSRSVRRSILLAQKLEALPKRGQARAAARREVIRRVEDAIQREWDGEDVPRLEAELQERLDAPEFDEELDDRPVEAIITDICHDLGLDDAQGLWKRRAPGAVKTLWQRAAVRERGRRAGDGVANATADDG